jgi:hypothetical protein
VPTHSHGDLRGTDRAPRSRSFEGRFGRMFRNLPPARFSDAALVELGEKMIAPELRPRDSEPAESRLPAGYTFLGQFIAHDITFDPVSSLEHENDPDALVNFRTPRLDLDCVYGRGPADQPYLYAKDGVRLVLGDPLENGEDWDLPRMVKANPTDREMVEDAPARTERAIIGDPRNDENVIIGQLHAIFLRLHNHLANKLGGSADFATVQREVRWRYQWVVVYDFLRRIVDKHTFDHVLPHVSKGTNVVKDPPNCAFTNRVPTRLFRSNFRPPPTGSDTRRYVSTTGSIRPNWAADRFPSSTLKFQREI